MLRAVATKRLTTLHVRRCRSITDQGVAAVATAAAAGLSDLCLSETLVTAAAFEMLALQCPMLAALRLRQCTRIKDEAPLLAIAQNGQLRHLDISLVPCVSGALMLELAASCARTLVGLDLSFCRSVPANAVGYLLDACKELEDLTVFGCSQLSRAALRGHVNTLVTVCGEPTLDGGATAPTVPVKA